MLADISLKKFNLKSPPTSFFNFFLSEVFSNMTREK